LSAKRRHEAKDMEADGERQPDVNGPRAKVSSGVDGLVMIEATS
jgi:hypothetical protein